MLELDCDETMETAKHLPEDDITEKKRKRWDKVVMEMESDTNDSDSDSDEQDADQGVYVVERIDDKRIIDGTNYYFIKWKGWHESANTWEPLENLDGCPKLVKNFEEKYAEKKKQEKKTKRQSTTKSATQRKRKNDSDEDEDLEAMKEAQEHMRNYGILTKWPADKEPISVNGVITVDKELTYVVKRKVRLGSDHLNRSNAVLVQAKGFRTWFPELVIKYYESRVVWTKNKKTDEEQARIASQISLLRQNNGSRLGKLIANDIDMKMREEKTDVKQINDVKNLEEDVLVIDAGDDDLFNDDDDVMEQKNQQVIKADSAYDAFGLPENMEDSEHSTSVSSSSDSDMEYIDDPNDGGKQSKKRAVEYAESDADVMDKY